MFPTSNRPSPRLAAAVFLAVTLLAIGSSLVLYFGLAAVGRPITLPMAMAGFGDWYVWLAISPLVVWLARGVPIDAARPWRGIGLHAVLGLLVALGELALFTAYSTWYNHAVLHARALPPFFTRYTETVARWLPFGLLVYAVIVAAVHVVDYHRRFRQRELDAARLQSQLDRARLQTLEMQLHPHFLFNTLNTIATLTREHDVDRAADMTVRLADLLRSALDHSGAQEVPLAEELEFTGRYLDLERTRFGDRLQVRVSVEPGADAGLVPVMVLQPLVENSMRHALARRARGGRIEIGAGREDGRLRVWVYDDGPGFDSAPAEGGRSADTDGGLGLANTRARLDCLYGDDARLELGTGPLGGASVTVHVPWHTTAARHP